MVKNKSSLLSKSSKILLLTLKTAEFFTFIAVLDLFANLWQKPDLLTKFIPLTIQQPTINLDGINSQISNLNKNIDILSNAVLGNQEKFDLFKENLNYFNKSKADLSEISNIENRLYNIEKQTSLLSKKSNNAAMLLTIALLIRDNISKGLTCQNEAEGLKILANNINAISEDVDFVASHCHINFISDNTLINGFNEIYKEINTPTIEADWKKRITAKIGEYVKISTPKNKNDVQVVDVTKVLEKIKSLVNNGDFAAAASVLSEPENSALLEDEKIYNWYQQTENQLNFYKALSNIINNSLLIMKVEDARNDQE